MAEYNPNDGIVVLEPVIKSYVFSRQLRGDEAREVFDEVKARVKTDFKEVPAFDAYFEFNDETGKINGSNLPYAILVNQTLGQNGLWLPTIAEAKMLDAKGKLSNDVYRDFGLVVYNDGNPNSETAKRIIEYANQKALQLPVLSPIRALGLRRSKSSLGVDFLIEDDFQVISGEEAREYIKNNFRFKGSSGARGVGRRSDGLWLALWGGLGDSGTLGRVDWLCGEATPQNLEASVLGDLRREANENVAQLQARIDSAVDAARKVMKS